MYVLCNCVSDDYDDNDDDDDDDDNANICCSIM